MLYLSGNKDKKKSLHMFRTSTILKEIFLIHGESADEEPIGTESQSITYNEKPGGNVVK